MLGGLGGLKPLKETAEHCFGFLWVSLWTCPWGSCHDPHWTSAEVTSFLVTLPIAPAPIAKSSDPSRSSFWACLYAGKPISGFDSIPDCRSWADWNAAFQLSNAVHILDSGRLFCC